MGSKQDALKNIVSLATEHQLTIKDIQKAFDDDVKLKTGTQSSIMQRLFSYLGGIFIFAGIGVFTHMYWGDMNTAARLLITLGAGFVAYLLALNFLKEKRFAQAVTPLFLIAAFLEPTGLFVLLDEFSTGKNVHHGLLFVSGVMLIQQGGSFLALNRTVLAFTSLFFLSMFNTTILDMLELDGDLISLVIGISILITAYRLSLSKHHALSPFAYFAGSICALCGAFELIENSSIEILYLGITSGFIYLSTAVHSRTLLFISCIAMLWYIGDFSAEHFANSIGWPLTLIVFGFIMLGIGSFAFKLSKQIKEQE